MKILIHSNAPWCATGYGQQCAQLAKRLQADGHSVAISAFYGLQGTLGSWDDMPVYPAGVHPYGADVLLSHAEDHFGGDARNGLIITLVDAWVLPVNLLSELNVACWAPIDHEPAPPRVINALRDSKCLPVAMSLNGMAAMRAAGLDPVYAPHGIDTSVLYPMDPVEARKTLGLPEDKFIVGMVAANKGAPSRKGFDVAFQAFANLHKKHPDTLLYLHTEVRGVCEGVNLIALAQQCDIPIDAIAPMHQYRGFILGYPPEHMRIVHSALDVLINPAVGEGFGIPVVEAQACGTPVITTDWTAMRELTRTGWKVEGQKFWTTQDSWASVANVPKLCGALQGAYKKARSMRDKAPGSVREFDADRVYQQYWKPIIERFENPDPVPAADAVAPVVEVERIAA